MEEPEGFLRRRTKPRLRNASPVIPIISVHIKNRRMPAVNGNDALGFSTFHTRKSLGFLAGDFDSPAKQSPQVIRTSQHVEQAGTDNPSAA
jgi:hypothetical protein